MGCTTKIRTSSTTTATPSNSPFVTQAVWWSQCWPTITSGTVRRRSRRKSVFRQPFRSRGRGHAGGAVVFPSYDLGEEFDPKAILPPTPHTFKDTLMALNASEEASSEGYLIDEEFPSVVFSSRERNLQSSRTKDYLGVQRGTEESTPHSGQCLRSSIRLQGGNESDGE